MFQKSELGWITVNPQHTTESSRVMKAQQSILVDFKVHMIVHFGMFTYTRESKASGHAEMYQQMARLELNQDVLRTPNYSQYRLTDYLCGKRVWYRPTQSGLAYDKIRDSLARQKWRDSTNSCFHFG